MACLRFFFLGGIISCWSAQVQAASYTVPNPFVAEGSPPEAAPVQDGEDAAAAALRIALEHGQYDDEAILEFAKQSKEHLQGQDGFSSPKSLILRSGGAYMKRAEEHIKEKRLVEGAADCLRALMRPGLDPTATEPMRKKLEHAVIRLQKIRDMELKDAAMENEKYAAQNAEAEALAKEWIVVLAEDDRIWQNIDSSMASDGTEKAEIVSAWQNKQYQATIDAAKAIPTEQRSETLQLVIARSYAHLGKLKQAIGAITDLLNACDKSGEWADNEPRLLASVIGALLALRFGDIDKAKKMYQIVLRNDPEQKYVKLRYKALKSYTKVLSDIEELLRQSKNRDVVKAVERAKGVLEKVMGKEGAVNAGTRLLLFECKAKSAMPRFHDEAIEACNTAIEQFENHDNPSPSRIAEAYVWRAEANMKDKSYDDAVADFQVAMTKVQGNKEYERQHKEAKKAQDEWNKAEEQHDRRGKSMGSFYVNRPSKEMLDLPDNIDELSQEEKCSRVKQAFRKMSLRWHPDKAIGGKKRAQRKSAEMGEAKSFLEVQWGCKGMRRRPEL